jgi:hypothetical protein
LITINHFPISLSHTNLVINCDKCFAQVLSNELISQALEIFQLTTNNTLKLGFDSLGAGCVINHLHFELIWMSDFKLDKLAIEEAEDKQLFSTNLMHKTSSENEFSIVSNTNFYVKIYNSIIMIYMYRFQL